MTQQQQHTTAELREMAREALRLASKTVEGPWELRSDLPYSLDGAVIFSGRAEKNYTICRIGNAKWPKMPENIAFIIGAKKLVPDLATALLAALDRVEELEDKLAIEIVRRDRKGEVGN
jgi:hypothetical protein